MKSNQIEWAVVNFIPTQYSHVIDILAHSDILLTCHIY